MPLLPDSLGTYDLQGDIIRRYSLHECGHATYCVSYVAIPDVFIIALCVLRGGDTILGIVLFVGESLRKGGLSLHIFDIQGDPSFEYGV